VLPASISAQISWSKGAYHVTGYQALRADFTGDGYPDLFVYDGNTISVPPTTQSDQA